MPYTFIFLLSLVVVVVQGYGVGKVPTVAQPPQLTTVTTTTTTTTTTTRRNVLTAATKQVAAIIATSGTVMTIATTLTTTPEPAVAVEISACPPKSQNCIRTTWTVPTGTKDVTASTLQLFQMYPQEGQSDVDKGGYTIIQDGSGNNNDATTIRIEYKSGIGNFAKYFNGGKPFIDDVIIVPNTNNADAATAAIDIRSASRVGESDFGVNQKRLQYLANKAREMGWDVPDPKY
jgi:uncharacterized protein (DUF1499 family)